MQTLTTTNGTTAIGVSGQHRFVHLSCNTCNKVWRRLSADAGHCECPFCHSSNVKKILGEESLPAEWNGMVALSPLLTHWYYQNLSFEERLRKGKQIISNGYISLSRGGWFIEHEGEYRSLSMTPTGNGVDFLALETLRNLFYGIAKRYGLPPAVVKDDLQLALWSVKDILAIYQENEPAKIGDFKHYVI